MKLTCSILGVLFFTTGSLAQTNVDDVINKVITAQGGKEKLVSINSVVMKGYSEFSGQKIPFNYYVINKTAQRTELTLSGLTAYFIITKDSGFNFNPFQGQMSPEKMTAEDLKLAQNDLDLQGLLVNYKEKGYAIELLENEDVDGVDAIQLKISVLPDKTVYYFIDPSDYYIIRKKTVSVSNGQQSRLTADYYNFKKTSEGVLFPFSYESNFDGNITFETIEVNKPLDEKLFKPTR